MILFPEEPMILNSLLLCFSLLQIFNKITSDKVFLTDNPRITQFLGTL